MAKKNESNNPNGLTEEQLNAIKNYSENIETLKDFVTAVRTRLPMYLGYYGTKGFIRMFREVFQNSIDELQRKYSPCNTIWVTYDERNNQIIIEDNGRGLPFDNILRIITNQHTSTNYTKQLHDYTSGLNGVGLKVVNAVCETMIIESYVLGEARRVEFKKGYPWKKGEVAIPNKKNKQGTVISFTPDYSILGDINVSCEDIMGFINQVYLLTNIGSVIHFKGIRMSGEEFNVVYKNEVGIMDILVDICPKPMIKPIVFAQDNGTSRCNCMLTYDVTEGADQEIVVSYSNFCPTDYVNSSHTKGCIRALRKFFIDYMNKVYLNSISNTGKKKQKSITIVESDIRTGLRLVLDVACLEPTFTGQSKDVLDSEEMENFMYIQTLFALEEWAKNNPQSLQKLCKYFKDIASLRSTVDEKRVKLQNQYNSNTKGLPSKYIAPTEELRELFITEGQSAAGSMENYRDNKHQGVFPIRGMIINCFENTEAKCLANAEVAGILAVIGGGYGKNFDINKVKLDKVILTCDGDSAGNFISTLLLRMFMRFCPQLITAGKVYRAVPPLYYITQGKKKHYFADRMELTKFIQKSFNKSYQLASLKKKNLTDREVFKFLYHNIDYIYEMDKIANRYRVNPLILEIYLNNRKSAPDAICKLIKKKYRFMDKKVINGHTCCDGIADGISNTLIMSDRMLNECKEIIAIMNGNLYDSYLVNGIEMSVYEIMKLYEKCSPSHLTRLKGLGEQAPEELAESVVYPPEMGGGRTLIQYTMSAAMKEIEEIRALDSNKALLLKDLVVTRLDVAD